MPWNGIEEDLSVMKEKIFLVWLRIEIIRCVLLAARKYKGLILSHEMCKFCGNCHVNQYKSVQFICKEFYKWTFMNFSLHWKQICGKQ